MKLKTRQYAQAIYDIAKENNQTSDYLDLALAIIDTANHNEALFKYLGATNIAISEKSVLIKDITDDNEYFANWLNILLESGKGRYIREYIDEFINIYNEEHNISNGYVWTTEPVDRELVDKFEKLVSEKLNKEVKLQNKINNQIIGGIRLEVGDNVWDNTIKNKLIQLFKEGSEINE